MYENYLKRLIDVAISCVALLILFIPIIVISVLIKVDSQGPALFKQIRLGRNQKQFTIYKFRTMVVGAAKGGKVRQSTDARITKVGAVLRRTSLDEILQFVNILKGDMAIIGPRPILPEEFAPYKDNPRYWRRYDARPGLSCTIDIKHKASEDRDLQFTMDADYVDNITFWNDIRICLQLAGVVLLDRKIYEDDV